MNKDATSLDRLHDIATPPAVPWWPLAPGWYVLASIVLLLVLVFARRWWKNWKANAYRRAALRALENASDPAAVAEVLRRTALVIAPRSLVAEKTGSAWADWLSSTCAEAMPAGVRAQLAAGIYDPTPASPDLNALQDYASRWINHHQILS